MKHDSIYGKYPFYCYFDQHRHDPLQRVDFKTKQKADSCLQMKLYYIWYETPKIV